MISQIQPGRGKTLMSLDCPNISQRLHLHGGGSHDLQFYVIRHHHEDQSLAIRLVFCVARNPVSISPNGTRNLGFVFVDPLDSALLIQTGGAVSASGNDKTRNEILLGEQEAEIARVKPEIDTTRGSYLHGRHCLPAIVHSHVCFGHY